jgi:hypothetical protein
MRLKSTADEMVTEYIFGEIFPSQGILYKVIDGIGKYIAFLRNMNPRRKYL